MDKKTVLVLNGGNAWGYIISRSLNMSVLYRAISASSYEEESKFTFDEYYSGLPFVQESNFVEELNKLIHEKHIEFIFPTHDAIALELMKKADSINATIICSPVETTWICRYKSETYNKLSDCDFVPKWNYLSEESETASFPLFLKPDVGGGSRGVLKVNDKDELLQAQRLYDGYVSCEYLPGDEFSVDCFTKSSGELIFINPRKRERIIDGKSALATCADNIEEFEKIANIINDKIKFRGYWFFQLKRDVNGKLKLLEIATRFAGTVAHAHASGANLPLMAVSDFSGIDVSCIKNSNKVTTAKVFIDRYEIDMSYDRIYIDYDDTVTCNGGNNVNSQVMAWLYQCKNLGKEIILITRHSATKNNTLSDDMERLSISQNLFSKIIDLSECQNKEDLIGLDTSCIFVDNSFLERKKVSEKCGIPVFDVCHIDCLYDWKKL